MESMGTNIEILANRPDTIIKNKTDDLWLVIDVAIRYNRNVIKKEAGK
jgi:hypothetical protein